MPVSFHRAAAAALILLVPAGLLCALELDPIALIGLDLRAALEVLGLPREVFPFRGEAPAEDNVVFFYPDYVYLFWYRDRVWQVRCDRRFDGTVFGVRLGMSIEEARAGNGRALIERGDSIYFDVTDAAYPIRVRLVFADGLLNDVYVYRSDY